MSLKQSLGNPPRKAQWKKPIEDLTLLIGVPFSLCLLVLGVVLPTSPEKFLAIFA